jgi:phosphate transport system substrate-binding protein
MSDDEMAKIDPKRGVILLPMTAGSIAVAYNLPGKPPLELSRSVLAAILTGEIKDWSDERLAERNKGLPKLAITVVSRSEGSGTTYAFTNHLAAAGSGWTHPATKSWPTKVGVGAKGNSGVAALIDQTPGAIGYIETGYAELSHLPTAALENKAGKYIKPDAASGKAALAEAKPKVEKGKQVTPETELRLFVPDPEGPDAYPIVTYTWILCHKNYPDEKAAKALKDVLLYCLNEGQAYSKDLGYIPLPEGVAKRVRAAVESIQSSERNETP